MIISIYLIPDVVLCFVARKQLQNCTNWRERNAHVFCLSRILMLQCSSVRLCLFVCFLLRFIIAEELSQYNFASCNEKTRGRKIRRELCKLLFCMNEMVWLHWNYFRAVKKHTIISLTNCSKIVLMRLHQCICAHMCVYFNSYVFTGEVSAV